MKKERKIIFIVLMLLIVSICIILFINDKNEKNKELPPNPNDTYWTTHDTYQYGGGYVYVWLKYYNSDTGKIEHPYGIMQQYFTFAGDSYHLDYYGPYQE